MYRVAVVGDYDSIYGFKALGMETFPVNNADEGEEIMKTLADSNVAVIYVTENLAKEMGKIINKYIEKVTPAIIQIPGIKGNTGAGVSGVKKSVEQAVGSDILFGEDM
ncbi:MAG: V-type ATP synthase subunit F [Lachnospiraceae bacterium]|nr:V-type ATP synthase subunit F [Lachnospiraceae bacterium]